MKAVLIIPETIEEWHSPEIPVIESCEQRFLRTGLYLLKGNVSVVPMGQYSNITRLGARHNLVGFQICVRHSDDEKRRCWLSLRVIGEEHNDGRRLIELLNGLSNSDNQASGLEGLMGIFQKASTTPLVNYMLVAGLFETALKGSQVKQLYTPPLHTVQAIA